MAMVVKTLRHEILKNWSRISNQGQKLPYRTKFYAIPRIVGATFSDFVWEIGESIMYALNMQYFV